MRVIERAANPVSSLVDASYAVAIGKGKAGGLILRVSVVLLQSIPVIECKRAVTELMH